MTIPYPDKPWVDGQTFAYTTNGGDPLVATYFVNTNSWSFSPEEDTLSLASLSARIQSLEQQIDYLTGNQS